MSDIKHTPGPWLVEPRQGLRGTWIYTNHGDDKYVVLVCGRMSDPNEPAEEEANARLIAAAPDMLAALHKVVLNNWGDLHPKDRVQVRAAIAKAEG